MHLCRNFGVLFLLAVMSLGAEGISGDRANITTNTVTSILSGWMRVLPKRADLYPSDAEIAEYLSYLRDGYDGDVGGNLINNECFHLH